MEQKKVKGKPELGRPPTYPQVEFANFAMHNPVICRHCKKSVSLFKMAVRVVLMGRSNKYVHDCGNLIKIVKGGANKDH